MFSTALLLLLASDLSNYRQFHFGMDLPAAEKLANLTAADSKLVSKRPALIETLEWQPRRGSTPDSVDNVDLTFYNNELFRMVINYQRLRTEGMTTEDMIESISAMYGSAMPPGADIMIPSYNNETVKVLARWEDARYSFNLIHSFMASYSLIGVSKAVEPAANAAMAEALKLDRDEAPANELARTKKHDSDVREALEKARAGNKAGFRP